MDINQQNAKRFLEDRYGRGLVSLTNSRGWYDFWHCDIVVDASDEEVKEAGWRWREGLEKELAEAGINIPSGETEMGHPVSDFSISWWTPGRLRECITGLREYPPHVSVAKDIARYERWLRRLEACRNAEPVMPIRPENCDCIDTDFH